ncbi:MAG TPA: TIR domain-containing protein [Mycobacteriales bacterium]|nr:TIR domain-containing protein [Mycobacteriales bacterium]
MGDSPRDIGARDADVLISYSRHDAAFATRLARALKERGKSPWLDVQGIEDGEVFPAALREAIERTDGMVFVISPAAASSPFCQQEVDHALALGKRIVPVLHSPVPDDQLPPGIRERQWVQAGKAIRGETVDRLVRALDADPDHTRQHTQLLLRARAWESRGRGTAALARGEELAEAEAWLTRAQGRDPAPTNVQAEWIAASRRSATRRQRMVVLTAAAVSVISVALLAFALVSRSQAVGARAAERSRALAAEADSQLARDPQLSILLAEKALEAKATPEAMFAATRALDANTARSQLPSLGAQPCIEAMRLAPLAGGRRVAVATCDGRLFQADLALRRIVREIRVGAAAGPVARSRQTLAVGTNAGVTLVHTRDWAVRERIHLPFQAYSLAFDPSGRRLAVLAPDRVALIHIGEAGVRTFVHTNGPLDHLLNVAWADRHTILAGGFDGPPQRRAFATGLVAIDVRTGHAEPIQLLRGRQPPLRAGIPDRMTTAVDGIAVSRDRRAWFIGGRTVPSLATSGGRAEVWRIDARTHHVEWRSPGPTGQYATSVAASPDGGRLAVGYGAGLAVVLDAHTGAPVVQLPGHTTAVRSVLFRTGSAPVVTASQDGVVRTWAGQGTQRAGAQIPERVQVLLPSVGSANFVGIGQGAPLLRFDGRTGRIVGRGRPLPAHVEESYVSDDHLAEAYVRPTRNGGRLVVFDGRTGDTIGRPAPFTLGSFFGVGGTGLVLNASGTPQATIRPRLFDPRTGRTRTFDVAPAGCGGGDAAFSPDESRVAVVDICGLVEIYDVHSGRLLRHVQLTDRATANGEAWSPDSRRLYLGVAGGSLVVLNADTGTVQERPGSQDVANSVAVSPDGRFVALGGSSGIVDVYDAHTLRLVRQHVLPRPVKAVTLSARSLAVLDEHYTLRIWDTCAICEDAAALQQQMRAETVRSLTPGERATFGV